MAITISGGGITTNEILNDTILAADINSAVELGGPSLGASSIIRTNGQTISENITIPSTSNGMTVGTVTIADTYTVTVSGVWVVL